MVLDTVSFEDSLSLGGGGRRCWVVRALQSARPLASVELVELPAHGEVCLGRGTAPVRRQEDGSRVTLHLQTDDERMSTAHARLVQRAGQWLLVDEGSKNGSFVNGERVSSRVLDDGDRLEIGATVFVYRHARQDADLAELARSIAEPLPAMRTAMPELASRLSMLRRVAGSALPLLIRGETGTGKELAARAFHLLSERPGAFVAVNCGALPPTLVESQLFGFKKGAFSGAERDALGLVRAAEGGTLFLDEIAELSQASQVALLRVLQEREVLPVGATAPIPVDVRIVAATHRDLEGWIADGRFREDLFARVAGAVLELCPLRARKEDLGLLVGHMLLELAGDRAESVRFTRKAARALFTYDWPRNVRELRSALELALTASQDDVIAPEHLPDAVTTAHPRIALAPSAAAAEREPSPDAIVDALRREGGNVSAAARRSGYSRAHFNRLLKRFGIDPTEYRG